MTLLTEGQHRAEFFVSESNGHRSREEGVLALLPVNDLQAGAVLGQVTASGEYAELNPALTDGTENAAAILWDNTDATVASQRITVLVRDCEVNLSELQFNATLIQAEIDTAVAQLSTLGIIAR